ncbi:MULTISPECIES: MerR family transcriptional regulator [Thermodesulfovibrio]|uniref:Transcription regulator protein n=1 Tax=Thermodesulfovibrio yellowstonii (strain ATCC 51303 / DSM 11347 / YP87) TaxID=289376 RepID=B5YLD7_THEYD|nr:MULTISPECIES: MerR family transcriptional regulator [Thermodesulfovibrio]ACI22125.1 transcription regulator protein [Thermodesulfovibrio yellowstonii DSM 11347]MDI6864865.1 MerR family transcriptional regulator [Thermodesulfovibrio yellowstonii]
MGEALQKELPFKIFYKIGETSRIVGVEPYVLRYWETEFPFLKPKKTKTGQRLYTKKDIEIILLIKKMLYEDRYTVEGVRQKLGNRLIPCERFSREDIIEKIRYKLKEILRMLS